MSITTNTFPDIEDWWGSNSTWTQYFVELPMWLQQMSKRWAHGLLPLPFFYVQTQIFFNVPMLYCKLFICAMDMVGSKKSAFVVFFMVSIQFQCELREAISRHFPFFQGKVGDKDIENIIWTSFTHKIYCGLWETIPQKVGFRTIVYYFCLFARTTYLSVLVRFEDLVMVRKGWKAQYSHKSIWNM